MAGDGKGNNGEDGKVKVIIECAIVCNVYSLESKCVVNGGEQ